MVNIILRIHFFRSDRISDFCDGQQRRKMIQYE